MNENLFVVLKSRFPTELTTTFIQTGSGRLFSYADMLERSAQYANAFTALGLGKGDRIAVQVEKSTEALMAYLGAIRAGAAFLPLNTAYTPAEVAYFLGDAEPAIVVCSPSTEGEIRKIAGEAKVVTLGEGGASGSLLEPVDAASTDFEEISCETDDLAAILYTSGTTGRSKGAMLTHRNLSSNAEALASTWRFTPDDILLHALPIYHTHGLFTACNTILHAGASMIFLPKFRAEEVVQLLPRATAMMGVPTFYSRLLGCNDLTRDLVSHMRVFISGSAPLSPDVHRNSKSAPVTQSWSATA